MAASACSPSNTTFVGSTWLIVIIRRFSSVSHREVAGAPTTDWQARRRASRPERPALRETFWPLRRDIALLQEVPVKPCARTGHTSDRRDAPRVLRLAMNPTLSTSRAVPPTPRETAGRDRTAARWCERHCCRDSPSHWFSPRSSPSRAKKLIPPIQSACQRFSARISRVFA